MKQNATSGRIAHTAFWMALIALLSVTGCASLSKDECRHADWRVIGYEDGARGYEAGRIARHREACARHGIVPDFDVYEKGRLEGLREYCRPEKGYRLGATGTHYDGVCPDAYEAGFIAAYREGKEVYGLSRAMGAKERELDRLHSEYDGVEEAIGDCQAEIVADGVDAARRLHLLSEILRLTDERRALADDIEEAAYELESLRSDLAEHKARNPY